MNKSKHDTKVAIVYICLFIGAIAMITTHYGVAAFSFGIVFLLTE